MTTEVDICNIALSRLGDRATVTSLSPPDGSVQSQHCARFLPLARDSLLEQHDWGFATKRVSLALLSVTPPSGWAYAYAPPGDVVNYLSVIAVDAEDDFSVSLPPEGSSGVITDTSGNWVPVNSLGYYVPQLYEVEVLADGTPVLYTNQPNAVLRYSSLVTDSTQFSPLFTDALSWRLAADLAGPLLKGDAGAKAGQMCLKMADALLQRAKLSDANQRLIQPAQNVSWMSGR